MKKRLLSLVLCLVMVFSLLPSYALAADEITIGDEIYVEANAEGQTGWTVSQVQNWKSSSLPEDAAAIAENSTGLYVQPDPNISVVFEVKVAKETQELYKSNSYSSDYRDLAKRCQRDYTYSDLDDVNESKYGKELKDTKAENNQIYCIDENGDYHKLFYNVKHEKNTESTSWFVTTTTAWFLVQVFYYTNVLYETSHPVTNAASYSEALSNGWIKQIGSNGKANANGGVPLWAFGFKYINPSRTAWEGLGQTRQEYDNNTTYLYPTPTYYGLHDKTSQRNYSFYYEDGGFFYLSREMVNDENKNTWNGTLYYKKNAAAQTLPEEAYPLDIPAAEPTTFTTDSGATISNPGEAVENDVTTGNAGLRLKKLLDENAAGTYDLTLESYAAADATKQTVQQKDPTDFVIVVDQSGSMQENDMAVNYTKVTGDVTLENVADGQYYTRGADGRMYRVYAVQGYLYQYFAPNTKWVENVINESENGIRWFQGNQEQGFSVANQYYFRDSSTGKVVYRPITVTVAGQLMMYSIRFHYTDANGTDQYFHYPDNPYYYPVFQSDLLDIHNPYTEGQTLYGTANAAVKVVASANQSLFGTNVPVDTCYTYAGVDLGIANIKAGMYINYPMYKRHVGYTKLCYRDINGEVHTIATTDATGNLLSTEYCDASGNATTTKEAGTRMLYTGLYRPAESNGTTTRLAALKDALTAFATRLANEKNSDGEYVDNRVAIVGFAEANNSSNNTEILTQTSWTSLSNYTTTTAHNQSYLFPDGVNYNGIGYSNSIPPTQYQNSLVPAQVDGSVSAQVTAAIDAVTANGGTQPETGLDMALNILQNRTVEDQSRNSVVIMFTDGRPGDTAYIDQYAEANDVVAKAKEIKDNPSGERNTMLFTIGVFSESDMNPLTYVPQDGKHVLSRANSDLEYEDGWMRTLTPSEADGWYYYYLKRQWRPNNDAYYGETETDTIYDYMSVTSSNYPAATDYIDRNWLVGAKDQQGNYIFQGNYQDAVSSVRHDPVSDVNLYYRMASNQKTLIDTFEQMVTKTVDMFSSDISVTLDSTAALKDQINTEDFDVSNASYSVSYVPIKATLVEGTTSTYTVAEDPTRETYEILTNQAVPASGLVSFSGYSWVENHIYAGHPDGYKLVMKITGLQPKKYNTNIASNTEAGVYSGNEAVLTIASPTLNVPRSTITYIADFNAKLILATEVADGGIAEETSNNGVFSRTTDSEAVYQLNTVAQKPAPLGRDHSAVINRAYSQVDRAVITGKHIADGESAESMPAEVEVIPASSIYFDDELAAQKLTVGAGYGFNEDINATDATASMTSETVDGTARISYFYSFYGSAIDIYCTTHEDAGHVVAAVFSGTGESACVEANLKGTAQTIRNYSSENYYNVPTLHFDLNNPDYYTVKINVLKTSGYRLDGIRVYGATDTTLLSGTSEANAHYLNMRKLMLNDIDAGKFAVTQPTIDTISGVLFVDDAENIVTQASDGAGGVKNLYQSVFEAYEANSPKNEIYLSKGQAITFQLDTDKMDAAHVYIGMSTLKTGGGTVNINGVPTQISSVVDMYYPVRIPASGSVTVFNNSDNNIISLTNLKITGVSQLVDPQEPAGARSLFKAVTMKTVRMAANNGVDPEETTVEPEVTPTPSPTETPSIYNIVRQIISSFVNSLFKSISRLFGN